MDFNDRRALKAAQGPSLASPMRKRQAAKGAKERLDVRLEAGWGESSKAGNRKARFAAATNKIEKYAEYKRGR